MSDNVLLNFSSADGTKTKAYAYAATAAEYEQAVANGLHEDIIAAVYPAARNELGEGARLVSITVNGIDQPA